MIILNIIANSILIKSQANELKTTNHFYSIFMLIADGIVVFPVTFLVSMHIYLVVKDKTTFDLILSYRKTSPIHPKVIQTSEDS